MKNAPELSPASRQPRRTRLLVGSLVAACLLAACAVEVQNTQPAKALARQAQPAGSVYTGWRVFQDKCSSCHGPAATGIVGGAPNLLPLLRDIGPRQFVSLVLQRYDWGQQVSKLGVGTPGREALIDEVVQGKGFALTMPAWQGEPSVSAHIVDLYAYLSARAQDRQGPGRPTP